jgi:aspartyl-tRNA(Asn)/glutamyl-tRNA(Gln) amidotransferase subunit C
MGIPRCGGGVPERSGHPLAGGASRGGRAATLGYHPGVATLSRADVEHVAHLARLGLSEEELARLEGQLNHILDQYAILARLDTDDIPPTAQTIELENILRDDVPGPSLSVEAVLSNAAQSYAGFIVVPPIMGTGE